MPCCSCDSTGFRDIYVESLNRLELIPRSNDFSRNPDVGKILTRTKVFEAIIDPERRIASYKPSTDPFRCDPAQVNLSLFLHRSELFWRLNEINPFNGYLSHELVIGLCHERALKKYEHDLKFREDVALPDAKGCDNWMIARWDFRLWAIAMCEFYHVVALLCESKGIPKSAKNWAYDTLNLPRTLFRSDNFGNFSEEAKQYIENTHNIRIKLTEIKKDFIASLDSELPSVFNTPGGPGKRLVSMDPLGLFNAVKEFWHQRNTDLAKHFPDLEDEIDREAEHPNSVPILALLEFITLRYTRSLCGEEDSLEAYVLPGGQEELNK